MRIGLVILCVTALTVAPALACPRGMQCLLKPLRMRDSQPALRWLRFAPSAAHHASGDVDMPWIWDVLRKEVYAHMPRYDEPQKFTLVLSPVVVKSPSDTVPGVGVAGHF